MPVTKKRSTKAGTVSAISSGRMSDPAVRRRFEKALARWTRKTKPMVEAVRASERLTDRDFAIRINAKA
jgi:hypothetical protein